jgi:hypothetical protein
MQSSCGVLRHHVEIEAAATTLWRHSILMGRVARFHSMDDKKLFRHFKMEKHINNNNERLFPSAMRTSVSTVDKIESGNTPRCVLAVTPSWLTTWPRSQAAASVAASRGGDSAI